MANQNDTASVDRSSRVLRGVAAGLDAVFPVFKGSWRRPSPDGCSRPEASRRKAGRWSWR